MKKLILILVVALCASFSQAQHNTYYVGHSGFGFSQLNLVGAMVEAMAADGGISTYSYGDQIIGGSCLSAQWENHATSLTGDSWIDIPAGNSNGQYDILVTTELIPFSEAMDPNAWMWGCNLSPFVALDNFHDMATAANPNTIFYLMEFHNEADFTVGGGTEAAAFANWSGLNASNRLLWEQVADSVSAMNGSQICIIPVAAATQALADSVMNGNFPGITNFIDIFEPTDGMTWKIHNTDVTTYLTACVHYATLFGQSPVGLTNELLGLTVAAGTAPTPAQALIMQEIAWETVINDPRSCVTGCAGTVATISPSSCNSYLSPAGNVYTASGSYTDVIINAAGCDSTITINLTVTNIDTSVVFDAGTAALESLQFGATYQWLDCDSAQNALAGATNQIYAPSQNGSFAVEVTMAGCVDTSSCHIVNSVGIDEKELVNQINVYPNPSAELTTIYSKQILDKVNVDIYNSFGQLTFSKEYTNVNSIDIELLGVDGVYLVHVHGNSLSRNFRVVKKTN